MTYLEYIILYALVGLIVLGINCIIAGFVQRDFKFKDIFDSVLWPLSVLTLFGMLIRIVYEKNKNKGK